MNISLSPLDDRYKDKTKQLLKYFSEYAFFKYRIKVEITYFINLINLKLSELDINLDLNILTDIVKNYNYNEYLIIKNHEKKINHDVKAVEYYLRDKFIDLGLQKYISFIHFGLTSQDVNNTSTSLQIKDYIENYYYNSLNNIQKLLLEYSYIWSKEIMLSKTHGQPAVPTTMGKEINVFKYRIDNQIDILKNIRYYGKFGGASGNLNAHVCAYPNINWKKFGKKYLSDLGLLRSEYTTQIDNYDNLSVIFDCIKRINSILIDLCQDIWLYISFDYLKQKIIKGEVGSSTMPHKVNPINFENAEGNLKLANNLLEFMSRKLPISRLQRDLTDSTVLRNLGVIFGHIELAFKNIISGLNKIEINSKKIELDLVDNQVVITEGIQTILRKHGYTDAYEKLKDFSRNNSKLSEKDIEKFINTFDENIKDELKKLNIFNYTGYSINNYYNINNQKQRIMDIISRVNSYDISLFDRSYSNSLRGRLIRSGKVRNIHEMDNLELLLLSASDRLSAFDRIICNIPCKGRVLNEISLWWFDKSKYIVPNHIIKKVNSTDVIVKQCKPIMIEFVVRAYMAGSSKTSIWKNYERGMRKYCGNDLPDDLKKYQKLPNIILTPTIKGETDELIDKYTLIEQNYISEEDWEICSNYAFKLFQLGQEIADNNGLILVDTKYEFGYDKNGKILLIDEVHTPDSSRYWFKHSYYNRIKSGLSPEAIDKEIIRKWIREKYNPYDLKQEIIVPNNMKELVMRRYVQLFEIITGNSFF